jgi:multisubunit Na+/H+ antiporter MnhE subunit
MRDRGLEFLVWFGAWALFDWKHSPADLLCGALVAAAVVGAGAHVARRTGVHLGLRIGWVRPLARVPKQIAADTLAVSGEALRRLVGGPPRGRLHDVPFEARGEDPRTFTRRALVTWGVTLSPNTVLAEVEPQHGAAVVHTFTPRIGDTGDPHWPLLS